MIIVIRLLFVLTIQFPFSSCIKTFHDNDLITSHLFGNLTNAPFICEELDDFYEKKNEQMSISKCIRFKTTQTLYCHGELYDFGNYSNKAKLERIENIVVCQHNIKFFDVSLLKYFLKLRNLVVDNSSFEHFKGVMPRLESLELLNISRTQLKSIKSDFFSNLSAIQLIDLRHNQLKYMERLMFYANGYHHSSVDHLVKIFLFGNSWDCTKNLKWMASLDVKLEIVDHSLLNCSDPKYRARPIITVMNYKSTLKRYCREDRELQNCSCHISFLRLDETTNEFHPMFSVNCSGAEFWNFPKQLPENTTTLYITHNNISSLDALCVKNSTYNEVQDIFLDYNQIKSTAVLENCVWFEKFRVLSLRGNQLERIPTYAFRNSFEKSQHATKLYLSDNPWLCSCRLQPRVQTLCMQYEIIVDQKQILCLNHKNDKDIFGRRLMELSRNDVCKEKEFPLDQYEIMSIIFTILIILLFTNFLYDYYHYRNYGKLPWFVIKML